MSWMAATRGVGIAEFLVSSDYKVHDIVSQILEMFNTRDAEAGNLPGKLGRWDKNGRRAPMRF